MRGAPGKSAPSAPHSGLLHFQDDLRAARSTTQRHVAAELERVAETLLGMEQNGLTGDLVRSEP